MAKNRKNKNKWYIFTIDIPKIMMLIFILQFSIILFISLYYYSFPIIHQFISGKNNMTCKLTMIQ